MTEVLSAQHINKSFSGVQVLHDVQFSLLAGEVHALLGENGAGKSTLLKTLFGMHLPDSGTLSVAGQPVVLGSPRDAQSQGIAMIHQELALIPELSVAQNVLLGNEGREVLNYGQMQARVRPFLEQVGLNVHPATPVKRLTIAQQQMVEIARAVARQARIIIMDEPTSSLTTHEIEQLYRVVRDLTARGVGIIYVSHHFDEIEELADRVTVLRDGRYIGTVQQREVTQDQLVTMMVGRELVAQTAPPARTPGAVRLEVRGLSGDGFRDVSLQVRAGEVVTLAGLIGAGAHRGAAGHLRRGPLGGRRSAAGRRGHVQTDTRRHDAPGRGGHRGGPPPPGHRARRAGQREHDAHELGQGEGRGRGARHVARGRAADPAARHPARQPQPDHPPPVRGQPAEGHPGPLALGRLRPPAHR